jgi:predicted ester cyclase
MPPDQNKKIARQMLAAFNSGDPAQIDSVVHPNFVSHTSSSSGAPPTREGLKQEIKVLREAFPDGKYKEEQVVAEGEELYLRWSMVGTHKGTYAGLPPSGKKITHYGQEHLRFQDGKIIERVGQEDALEFLNKLKK